MYFYRQRLCAQLEASDVLRHQFEDKATKFDSVMEDNKRLQHENNALTSTMEQMSHAMEVLKESERSCKALAADADRSREFMMVALIISHIYNIIYYI